MVASKVWRSIGFGQCVMVDHSWWGNFVKKPPKKKLLRSPPLKPQLQVKVLTICCFTGTGQFRVGSNQSSFQSMSIWPKWSYKHIMEAEYTQYIDNSFIYATVNGELLTSA